MMRFHMDMSHLLPATLQSLLLVSWIIADELEGIQLGNSKSYRVRCKHG